MNENRTCDDSDAKLTRGRSGPVRYELIDKNGRIVGSFNTANSAGEYAKRTWPDQEQDEDRTGKGWDVQVVGCE